MLNHKQVSSSFPCLLPSKINNFEFKQQYETDIENLVHRYEKIVNCSEQESIGELRLWCKYVSQMTENPKNAQSALHICVEKIFPTVRKLLLIHVTLSVTTATPERTFSTTLS